MTRADWIQAGSKQLTDAGVTSAELDARLILGHITRLSREEILAHPEDLLTEPQIQAAERLLQQRLGRKPLAQVLGGRSFYGLDIEVTADVLTPRVETETIVETVIKEAPKDSTLLDVGTGSGAIAIAIAQHRPDLAVTATDVSQTALAVAKRNAQSHEVEVKFVESNLFDQIPGRFQTITANLPYLTDDAELMAEVQHEPAVALHGGHDGLDLYRAFFDQIPDHLESSGLVVIEADPWQHAAIKKMAVMGSLSLSHEHYFILGFSL